MDHALIVILMIGNPYNLLISQNINLGSHKEEIQ